MTSGDGTTTTIGLANPDISYNFSIAGMIISGSIGFVRNAREIHNLEDSSIRAFSSGVIPPVTLVGVLTIAMTKPLPCCLYTIPYKPPDHNIIWAS
jgi:hypothetical protein